MFGVVKAVITGIDVLDSRKFIVRFNHESMAEGESFREGLAHIKCRFCSCGGRVNGTIASFVSMSEYCKACSLYGANKITCWEEHARLTTKKATK